MKTRISINTLAMAVMAAALATPAVAQEPAIPTIPQVEVRYAHSVGLDQTDAAIGLQRGWFEDVGITFSPAPNGAVLPSAERAANLIAGSVDVVATGAYNLIPSMGSAPNLRVFFQKDQFRGYRIMAPGDAGYKSVEEFVAEGLSHEEAIAKAVAQMQGKTIAYLSEPSRESFLETVYERGGLDAAGVGQINKVNVEDSQTIALMISGRSDFQLSAAPAMVELMMRGFKPIITAMDLAEGATPSIHSNELTMSQKVGWATTAEYMEANPDTILRLASVGFRIIDEIRFNTDEAVAGHVDFLNATAGTQMTPEFGKWIYEVVDPYVTFDEQAAWYADPRNTTYYFYEIGARILDAEGKGLLAPGSMPVDTLVVAPEIYWDLVELKAKSGRQINAAHRAIEAALAAGKDVTQAVELQNEAATHFAHYNFLDASRFADAALEWAEYAAAN